MGREGLLALGTLGTMALGAALVVGGAACSSVPDITFGDLEGGADSGVDGRVIDPNCKPSGAEICDDGLDNDCDGLIDCEDPQCTSGAFSCQDSPPTWKAVAFAPSARPSCAAGAMSIDLMVAGGDSTATCTTSCVGVGGSCTSGSYALTVSGDPACSVAPTNAALPLSATCQALGTPINVPLNTAHVKVTPPAPPASCAPTGTLTNPLTSGRECMPARYGGGCGANRVCAPKPATGLETCITTDGKSACPLGFTKRSTAGTTAVEGRTCTGATCGAPSACSGGAVGIYEKPDCKVQGGAKKGVENIDSTCSAAQPNDGFSAAYAKTTPPTGGCGAPTKMATPNGGVSFGGERTLCCK